MDILDKLRSYLSALLKVLPEVVHWKSEGLAADINNYLSERLQSTFRDPINTLRGAGQPREWATLP